MACETNDVSVCEGDAHSLAYCLWDQDDVLQSTSNSEIVYLPNYFMNLLLGVCSAFNHSLREFSSRYVRRNLSER